MQQSGTKWIQELAWLCKKGNPLEIGQVKSYWQIV